MDVSCSEVQLFRVEIPSRNIVKVPRSVWTRFEAVMGPLIEVGEWVYWNDHCRDVRVAEGKAHPLVVQALMALAQGHDLTMICELIEGAD